MRHFLGSAAIIIALTTTTITPAHTQPAIDWKYITSVLDWLELVHGDGVPGLIENAFGDEAGFALKVANCESGLNPTVTGGAGERGVFQLHPVHAGPSGIIPAMGYTFDDMYQPGPNVRVAYALYAGSGWRPWTCARR